MLQRQITPRGNWEERLCELGFDFYEVSAKHPYWCEDRYFQLTRKQVDHIDRVTEELHSMAMSALQYVFDNDLLERFGLPEKHHELLRRSWENDKSYLYGRFDFAWSGSEPKMLEYNANTPTSIFELAVAAWDWMRDGVNTGRLPANTDQFNLLDEQLIVQFQLLKTLKNPDSLVLHFACDTDSSEDRRTVTYLAACADEAGWESVVMDINDVQLSVDNQFADGESKLITNMFSLYPYEFALLDEYADYIEQSGCTFIEPLWKVLLSSKALLPIMWSLYEGHPNLLECYFADETGLKEAEKLQNKVIKPIYSREGANINIVLDGKAVEGTAGNYGAEGHIIQEYAPLAEYEHGRCVVGSWVIGKVASGISFRESNTLITNDVARFIPHVIIN